MVGPAIAGAMQNMSARKAAKTEPQIHWSYDALSVRMGKTGLLPPEKKKYGPGLALALKKRLHRKNEVDRKKMYKIQPPEKNKK